PRAQPDGTKWQVEELEDLKALRQRSFGLDMDEEDVKLITQVLENVLIEHNGHYEADVLNDTFFETGKNIEFGVVWVRFDGPRAGRGFHSFVEHRAKDATEEVIFEIMHNASYKYIGGLDAYSINYVEPRFHYMDHVWVIPASFAQDDPRGFQESPR
ncbi:unnamed protein product, partial [Prorocentrum cordatum]